MGKHACNAKRWVKMGRAALGVVLAAGLLGMWACSRWEDERKELLFDEPSADIFLTRVSWTGAAGGTLIFGDARNIGGQTAEKVRAVITAYSGDAALGTFTTEVSMGFDEETGKVIDTLDPDEEGSFAVTVPLSPGQITSVTVTFTWSPPYEEKE